MLDAPRAELARLAEGLGAAFQLLRDDALTVDTEAVMLDLFFDGTADLEPLSERADALAAALAASGPHAEAFRATFPPLALTLLHHAGGASALLDAGDLSSDLQPVGGIGRFVTALRAAQADSAKLDAAWEAEKDGLQQAYKKAHKKAAARKRRRLGEK